MRRIVRKLNALAILCSVSMALVSCGLEEYVYLYPPSGTSKTSEIFSFSNNPLNDPTVFIGYKLVYKFFPSISAVDQGIAEVTNRYTSSPTTIYTAMTGVLGFRPLKINTAEELKIDIGNRQDSFTIELDFSRAIQGIDEKNVIISVSSGSISTTPVLPADAFRSSGQVETGFSSEFLVPGYNDLLVDGNYLSTTGETFFLLYVLAYGQSLTMTSYTEVYSEPKVFIGSTNYIPFTVAQ